MFIQLKVKCVISAPLPASHRIAKMMNAFKMDNKTVKAP